MFLGMLYGTVVLSHGFVLVLSVTIRTNKLWCMIYLEWMVINTAVPTLDFQFLATTILLSLASHMSDVAFPAI